MMNPSILYNEIDSFAAEWIRQLAQRDAIAPGLVDNRSVEDLEPARLIQHTQCHFFAGIGAWSYALRLAGWPDDLPVWTASLPCQPFSISGKRRGIADERHLWPSFFWLVRQCRPRVIFGEQVSSADGLAWFDTVSGDLEAAGYTTAAIDLCAAGVGAPHIRQRLYWVAYTSGDEPASVITGCRATGSGCSGISGMANAYSAGLEGWGVLPKCANKFTPGATSMASPASAPVSFWQGSDWVDCRSGKKRPIEPGTFPLVDGIAFESMGRGRSRGIRSALLKGYGNSIVAPLAAEFIRSFVEVINGDVGKFGLKAS
jgi:DNA (cytosine-5)-methyltransferase 1